MSAIGSLSYQAVVPPEPFGQTGVRQYFGRMVAWACVTVGLCAAAMSHRSLGFADAVEWKGGGQVLQIISGNGQIAVAAAADPKLTGESGWSYRGSYGGNRWANRGPWKSAVGQVIGIEGRLSSPTKELAKGFWLRLRWPVVATLFMVQPVVYVARRLIARRRKAIEAPV